MELQDGIKAPSFSAVSDSEEKISLKDFEGKKVVLYCYPNDDPPGCTQDACDFRYSLNRIKRKEAVVLGVSKDDVSSHQKFKKKFGLTFPLLSDIDGEICEKYGVWKEKSMYGKKYMGIERSTFIIDEKGKIKKAYYKVKVPGHVDQIINDLKV